MKRGHKAARYFMLGQAGLKMYPDLDDLETIYTLCKRHKRAYEADTANHDTYSAQVRAADKARAIAEGHGWALDTGVGLWWTITIPGAGLGETTICDLLGISLPGSR